MANADQDPAQLPQTDSKNGRFYTLDHANDGHLHNVTLDNENDLVWDDELVMFPPSHRPEQPYPVTPRLGFSGDSKKCRLPRDFGGVAGFWLISERLKQVFEQVDPEGFVFVLCEFTLPDGSKGPQYYLCDVIRMIDALDEEASIMKPTIFEPDHDTGEMFKIYDFTGYPTRLVFKKDMLKGAHVFRTPFAVKVFCDGSLYDAVRDFNETTEQKISGLRLRDTVDL